MAESQHLGLRKLQRQLQQQGTSYQELLRQTRRELAIDYWTHSHRSMSEITYLLGFPNRPIPPAPASAGWA